VQAAGAVKGRRRGTVQHDAEAHTAEGRQGTLTLTLRGRTKRDVYV
jgi:hypothetical protein